MDATDWDARYAASELVWSAGPNRFVEESLGDLRPGRALDLACGEGRNALWLAGLGWSVSALDWSPVAIEKGRRLAGAVEVDWRVGDVLTAALPEALDLVVVAYLQLEPAARRTALRRAYDALAPGGTLFLVAHDSTNLTEGVGGPQDASVLCTSQDVLGDLGGRPVEVLRAERVARVVPDKGTAWDALVHLRRG